MTIFVRFFSNGKNINELKIPKYEGFYYYGFCQRL